MRAPLSWLAEHVDLPAGMTGRELGEVLIRAGLEVETVEAMGADITGPVVVGRVLESVDEPQTNGKTIRWVQVDVGPVHNEPHPDYPQGCRSVVCGAHNFAVGDLVVVSLPGSVLAGGFAIAARKTYGHVSDGMICAEDELGIGHDHTGIIVLPGTDDAGRALEPGDDPAGVLHLRDDVLDIDVSPDIGYCLSIRGLAREAGQNLGRAFTDVIDKATPAAVSAGYPVRLDDAGLPLVRRAHRHGHRPVPTQPALAGQAPGDGRDALDLAGRRHHQLRDARDRPAAARLRRVPAEGSDRRAQGCGGGDPRHARRRHPHPVGR